MELLACVAVVGILTGMALPACMRYVQRSYWASNITVADGLAKAALVCSTTDSGAFHYSRGYSVTASGTGILTRGSLDDIPACVITQDDLNPALALYHF